MLTDEIRYKLLKAIEENPSLSQRELAAQLGVSLGKTNYCIKALIKKGLIKTGNFKSNPNKAEYAYLLTPHGVREKARVTLRFLQRKMDEYEEIKQEINRLQSEVDNNQALAEQQAE